MLCCSKCSGIISFLKKEWNSYDMCMTQIINFTKDKDESLWLLYVCRSSHSTYSSLVALNKLCLALFYFKHNWKEHKPQLCLNITAKQKKANTQIKIKAHIFSRHTYTHSRKVNNAKEAGLSKKFSSSRLIMNSMWLWNSHQRHQFLRAEASRDILKFRVSEMTFPGVFKRHFPPRMLYSFVRIL